MAAEVVYKLSKEAAKLIRQGVAEWTPGGIRDINTKKILALARPVVQNSASNREMLQSLMKGTQGLQALQWANIAANLANLAVSMVGFYLMLTRMESLHGDIRQFIDRYKADQDADQFEKYQYHLKNLTSHVNFLQTRYTAAEYDNRIFMIRESDIESECNETASFLERILDQYRKGELGTELSSNILFTLAPVFAQLINEYGYQYYVVHHMYHSQYDSWKSVLDNLNSEDFRAFMEREMAFNLYYVNTSPVDRKGSLDIAFSSIQGLLDNLAACKEVSAMAPRDILVPVSELVCAKAWEDVRGRIKVQGNETPEEFIKRQINQMAIDDETGEEINIPLQVSYA